MGRDQHNRERILDTAAGLFHVQGFQPTSLDEILERSGVCRSNFYYHFRSKEDLGFEVLSRQASRFEARILQGILADRETAPRERLARLFDAVTARVETDSCRSGCPFGNLAAELCGNHPEFRARLSAFFRRWQDAVADCVREGVVRGQFRRDLDVQRAATAVVSQIEGAVLLTKAHGHRHPIEAGTQMVLQWLEGR